MHLTNQWKEQCSVDNVRVGPICDMSLDLATSSKKNMRSQNVKNMWIVVELLFIDWFNPLLLEPQSVLTICENPQTTTKWGSKFGLQASFTTGFITTLFQKLRGCANHGKNRGVTWRGWKGVFCDCCCTFQGTPKWKCIPKRFPTKRC